MKRLIAPLLLVISTACASTSLHSTSTPAYGSGSAAPRARAAKADFYILLSAPNQLREMSFNTINGFHVSGIMNGRGFSPVSQVEGNGQFCADGKDWLDLANLSVHKAAEGHPPVAPYLLGCAVSSGFQPASRDIVTQ
jgi:hypothetical protein